MAAKTKLVARTAELAQLEREWRRAADGEFRAVLLVGEPGVGKTRLAEEMLRRHEGQCNILSARAHSLSATASFGVWVEALERHLRHVSASELSGLCGGLLDDLASLLRSVAAVRGSVPRSEPSRPRLLEGLAVLLSNLAAERPLVIILDDLHQADASSWQVLQYLAFNLGDSPILVIGAARPGELAEHSLAGRVLVELGEEDLFRRVEVTSLDEEAVRELAEAVSGQAVGSTLLNWLMERARGNPLFVVGLVRALLDEQGDLTQPSLRSLPEELTARVRARADLLDRGAQELLEVLAVAGGRVDLGELASFSGQSLEALEPDLRRLTRTRLVSEEEREHKTSYEISHPIYQETIYKEIGAARRHVLHRQVGRALLVTGRLGEAALHFARSAESGDGEAIEVLQDALRQAEERGAYREGLKILDALVDLVPDGDERWLQVADVLSWDAEWVVDHRADAGGLSTVAGFRQIDRLLADSPDLAKRARVKGRLASFLCWGGSEDLAEAEDAARQASALYAQAGDSTNAVLSRLEHAYVKAHQGDLAALEVTARDVLQRGLSRDGPAALRATGIHGLACFYLGRFAEAEQELRRALHQAERCQDRYRVTWGLMSLAWSFGYEGRVDESLALFKEARSRNPDWRDSNALELESSVRWFAGDFAGAIDCTTEAIAFNPGGLSLRRGIAYPAASLASSEMDQPLNACRFATAARALYHPKTSYFLYGFSLHAEALCRWREGKLGGALDLLREASTSLLDMQAAAFVPAVLLDQCDLAAELGDHSEVAAVAQALEKLADAVGLELHRAFSGIAQARLHQLDRSFSHAAEEASGAVERLRPLSYPVLRARALEAHGWSRVAVDQAAAVAIMQEAVATYDSCGAVWRRDRALRGLRKIGYAGKRAANAVLGVSALTAREREIARLAAERLTAAEIGDDLCISRRTVEKHLATAYTKLGVTSRVELSRKLRELGL